MLVLVLLTGFLPLSGLVKAAAEKTPEPYKLLTVSTELPAQELTVYKIDDKWYMSIYDIGHLSRFTVNVGDDGIHMEQGLREITLDPQQQTIEEIWGENGHMEMIPYASTWLLEAVPALTYLGAECKYADGVFICSMPMYTFWEIWDENIQDYQMNLYELYGGEAGVNAALTCDIIMDMIFGQGLSGMYQGASAYVADALDEIMKVNILNRDSVTEEYESMAQKAASAYSLSKLEDMKRSDAVEAAYTSEAWQKLEPLMDQGKAAKKGIDLLECIDDWRKKAEKNMALKDALQKDPAEKKADYRIRTLQILNEIICSSMVYDSYDKRTRALLKQTFSEESLSQVGFDRLQIYSIDLIDQYCASRDSLPAILVTESGKAVAEELMDFWIENAAKYLDTWITNGWCGVYTTAWDLGVVVARVFNSDTIEAASGEMKAMFISTLQEDIYKILYASVRQMNQEGGKNRAVNEQLLNAANLFTRTTVAFCDNLLKKDNLTSEQKNYFQEVSRKMEIMNFKLSVCPVFQIYEYDDLEDEVLKGSFQPTEDQRLEAVPAGDENADGSKADAPDRSQKTSASLYTPYGYVVKFENDLYYMRFTKASLNQLYAQLRPGRNAVYDLVRRNADGSEETLAQITGNNSMGICGEQMIYSINENGTEYIRGISKDRSSFVMSEGVLRGASGQAAAYWSEENALVGLGDLGVSIPLAGDQYVGVSGTRVYTQTNDFGSQGYGAMYVQWDDVNSMDRDDAAAFYDLETDAPGTPVLSRFAEDSGDTYYAFIYRYGSRGLYENGPIVRVKNGDVNPEVLVEKASGEFRLVKRDSKTYLMYETDQTAGNPQAYLMNVETGEIEETLPQRVMATGQAVWDSGGIHAYLDQSGAVYTVFTQEELDGLGFEPYSRYTSMSSSISLQEDGAYIYLCQGKAEDTGAAVEEFVIDRGMLVRKNMQTGEITIIYQME